MARSYHHQAQQGLEMKSARLKDGGLHHTLTHEPKFLSKIKN